MRAQQQSEGLAAMNLDQMYSVCIYGMRMVRGMFWALLKTDTLMYQCILLNAYQSIAMQLNAGFDNNLSCRIFKL